MSCQNISTSSAVCVNLYLDSQRKQLQCVYCTETLKQGCNITIINIRVASITANWLLSIIFKGRCRLIKDGNNKNPLKWIVAINLSVCLWFSSWIRESRCLMSAIGRVEFVSSRLKEILQHVHSTRIKKTMCCGRN